MIHSLVSDAEPPCGSELVNASICLGPREPCTDRSCWEEAAPGVSTTHSRHTTPSSRELRLANSSDCFSERPTLRKLVSLCSGCLVVSGGQPVSGPARPLGGRYRSGGLFLKVGPFPTMYSSLYPQAFGVECSSGPGPESVLPIGVDKHRCPAVGLCRLQLDWHFLPHAFPFLSP